MMKKNAQARVALKLAGLSSAERVRMARAIGNAMTNNPNFPKPPVTPAALAKAADTLEQSEASAKAARQAATMRLSERDDAAHALEGALTQLASYVDTQAKGVRAVIDSAAMPVKGTPVRSTTPPPAPDALTAQNGDNPGEAKVKWQPTAGARSYVVERSANPNDATSWTHVGVGTKRLFVAKNVPSGRVWFRVAAIGAQGQGPWSDPATCIVS